jgi:hypothetical protein
MVKALVFGVSMAAGGVALGAVLYIQANPRAFTSSQLAHDEMETVISAPIDPLLGVVVHTAEAERSRGTKPSRRLGRAPVARANPISAKPCSSWRDLGPKAVAGGEDPTRRVRLLCP